MTDTLRPSTAAPIARRPVRAPWRYLPWLAGAGALPLCTHMLGADWLLPPLILVATASLLRSGRTLLDRLMIATALLLGTVCVSTLVFGVWGLGMAPVPLAATALTVLAVIAFATGRKPRLPRPTVADGFSVV